MANEREELLKLRRLKELEAKAGRKNLVRDPLLSAAPKEPETIKDKIVGAADAALSLGAGLVTGYTTAPVGGLAALGDMALRQAAGLDEPSPSREIIDKYSMDNYQPRTEVGKRIVGTITAPFRAADEAFTRGGEAVQDALLEAQQRSGRTDLPGYDKLTAAAATGVKMIPEGIGALIGVKLPRSLARRSADVAAAEESASRMGLDMTARYPEQSAQLQTYAENKFQPGVTAADDLESLQPAIAREREAQSGRIGQQFKEAEQMGASVPSKTAGGLADNLRKSVSGFVLNREGAVAKLLEEADTFGLPAQQSINEVMGIRNAAQVPVSDIFRFRAKINQNLPSDTRSPDYLALSRMRREVDGYLNETMVNDLVSGNPAAVTKYQDAIHQWTDFKTLFDENRVMRKLQDEHATPEQVKNLIFGLNAIRAPRQAGEIVKRLEAVLGPDSAEFESLRQSVLTDILMPVIDAEPNWAKFSQNVKLFNRNNPTLAKELFPPETLTELDNLSKFATAIEKASPIEAIKARTTGWERAAAVMAAGNTLARNALRISLLSRVFGVLKPNMGVARKNRILSETLGYDPRQSLFTMEPVRNVAAIQAAESTDGEPRTIRDLMTAFRGQ